MLRGRGGHGARPLRRAFGARRAGSRGKVLNIGKGGEMRAVMVSDGAPARLRVGEVREPGTAPSEALVRVSAVSLNRGEVRRSQAAEPGFRPGWDLAGTVERAAPDGTGPREGARVVGLLGAGAWSERAAVPVDALAKQTSCPLPYGHQPPL